MIASILSQTRNAEASTIFSESYNAWQRSALTTAPNLIKVFGTLSNYNTQLLDALKREKEQSILEQKDEVRDNAFRGLYGFVSGMVFHPNAGIKAAANAILVVLQKYGLSIVDENYATESANLQSCLLDLAKAEIVAAIAVIDGATELVAALQAAQTDFENTRVSFEATQAQESKYLSATQLKREAIGYFNKKLAVHLNGMHVSDEESYDELVLTIAQLVDNSNAIVRRRNQKDDTEEITEEETID